MSNPDDQWNPEDGPPPTEDERAEARAVADVLAAPAGPRKSSDREPDPDVASLAAVALRVRATAHPEADKTRTATTAAVEHAITNAGQRWYKSRWSWAAAAAVVVLGVGGTQWALWSPPPSDDGPSISHAATDVFSSAIGNDARSAPIGRIVDARMSAYRDVLLHHRGQAARRAR